MDATVALAGDAILNRRLSACTHEGFRDLVGRFRDADFACAHLETVIHDFEGPEVYPAAEAGGTWMASPPFVADELAWAGLDAVTHASNHALDYAYGGLRRTWTELDRVGVAHAGTGENLGDARSPTYVDTPDGRVALVSMTSSYPRWSRAGAARGDVRGRPGVNPLRVHHAVDEATMATVTAAAEALGWWVTDAGDDAVELNAPGRHNSLIRVERADDGATTVPDDRDLTGNCRAIRDADARADLVVAHLHTHEFRVGGDVGDPAGFVEPATHAFVDAGADIVVVQGTHSPIRGVELYDGSPILHDPGDFLRMADTVDRLPADFYERFADELDGHPADATPAEGLRARKGGGPGPDTPWLGVRNPPGGSMAGSVTGNLLPVCTFEGGDLARIDLYPGVWPDDPMAVDVGVPVRARGADAERVVADVAEKSAAYGTDVRFEDGRGVVEVD